MSSGRFSFVGQRLVQLPFLLFGVTVICFLLLRLIPGSPATAILGSHYTAKGAAHVNNVLGLNQSIPSQYVTFLGRLFHGNLGYSFFDEQPARTVIGQHLMPTVFLIVYAAVLAALVAIPVGLIAGIRRNGLFDQSSRLFFIVCFAMPSFWLGLILVLLLGVDADIFPINGYGNGFFGHLYYLFLPAFVLALPFSTVIVRALRSSVIGVERSDFVDTARIKGISSLRVLWRHIARNSLISVVSVFGVNLAYLVGGTVLVENVFSVPGLGSLLVSSVSERDYSVVQGITLIFALGIVLVNLLADIAQAALDPRVSLGGRGGE